MAKVTQGMAALAKANLVPEDDYDFVVRQVVTKMGDDEWEKAWCVIENPEEPSLATRRISYMLGSPITGDWRGLTELIQAAKLTGVPDGDYGDSDTRNLEGVTFPGRIFHRTGNRGLEAAIRPTIDHDWVAANMDEEGASTGRRRKKATTTKKRRRSSR